MIYFCVLPEWLIKAKVLFYFVTCAAVPIPSSWRNANGVGRKMWRFTWKEGLRVACLAVSILHARGIPTTKTVACWYANRLDRSFLLAPCPTAIPIAFTFAIPSQRNCLFYFPFALSFSFSFSAGSRHLLICIFQEANRRIGSGFQMSQVKAIFPPLPSPLFFYFSLSLSLFLFSLAGSLSLNVWCGTAQCGGAW